jgi:hypothetical protein
MYIYIYNIRTPGFGSFGRFADFASLGGPRIYIYIYIYIYVHGMHEGRLLYIYIYTHIRAAGFVHFLSFGNLASLGGPRLLGGWGCVWNAHRRGPVYTNIRTAGLMAFVRLASFGGPRIYTCMECTGGDYIYIYIHKYPHSHSRALCELRGLRGPRSRALRSRKLDKTRTRAT